jgi:hypothetical protein
MLPKEKMTHSPDNSPTTQDAILGGDAPAPAQAAVLGGLWQVQQQFNSPDLATKLTAMKACLNYGAEGITEVINALQDPLPRVQYEAYRLLRPRTESIVEQALSRYKFWNHFEQLDGLPNRHAQMFANRRVVEVPDNFVANEESRATAYAIRKYRNSWNQPEGKNIESKLINFLLNQTNPIEALVFGHDGWDKSGRTADSLLVQEQNRLPDLTALFLGDIEDSEAMISDIKQDDLGLILAAYPQLEVLHVRGDSKGYDRGKNHGRLRFSQLEHKNLMALTVETGGLNPLAVRDLCKLELPSLEYLELWLGDPEYGGTSSIEDLMPIVSGDVFPHLKYLGLRNCNYTDEIVSVLSQAPHRSSLLELDLSMGTLSDEGSDLLLGSHVVEGLETLNVSQCCFSRGRNSRFLDLSFTAIYDRLRPSAPERRYCVVRE